MYRPLEPRGRGRDSFSHFLKSRRLDVEVHFAQLWRLPRSLVETFLSNGGEVSDDVWEDVVPLSSGNVEDLECERPSRGFSRVFLWWELLAAESVGLRRGFWERSGVSGDAEEDPKGHDPRGDEQKREHKLGGPERTRKVLPPHHVGSGEQESAQHGRRVRRRVVRKTTQQMRVRRVRSDAKQYATNRNAVRQQQQVQTNLNLDKGEEKREGKGKG